MSYFVGQIEITEHAIDRAAEKWLRLEDRPPTTAERQEIAREIEWTQRHARKVERIEDTEKWLYGSRVLIMDGRKVITVYVSAHELPKDMRRALRRGGSRRGGRRR